MNQNELNQDMVTQGVSRYRRGVQSARERKQESETPYGQRLLRNYLPALITELERRIDYHRKYNHAVPIFLPLIWDMDVKQLAFLSFKTLLDCIGEKRATVSAAIHVASVIEDELRFQRMKELYPEVFKWAERDVQKYSNRSYKRIRASFIRHEVGEADKGNVERWKTWTRKEKTLMGTWLLELIRTTTHLIMFKTLGQREKTIQFVSATDELFEWMSEYNKSQEILKPLWLPTVEPPEAWSSYGVGGYSNIEEVPPLSLIKTFDYDYLKALDFETMKPVIDAVNHVQSVRWEVNEDILGVAKWAWQNNKEIGDMIRRDDYELPVWNPAYEGDEDATKEYSRRCGSIHHLNISMRSKRLAIMKTLWVAEKFEDQEFFYPHQLDFRGRMYPIPYYFSPQGSDLSKSLLRFATSKPIENEKDARWLAIHGANVFGKTKLTLDERVEWVKANRENIDEVHADPQTNDWWQAAEDPWQFLAFCREWSRFKKQGYGFKTKLPCAMDGANNGIQILSLLGRDEQGALATNVVATERPSDLYENVSDMVNEELLRLQAEGDHLATAWLKFGIDRKTTKLPVMVKPYGGTQFSCRELLANWYAKKCLEKEVDPFGRESSQALTYLNSIVWKSMNATMRRPIKVMKWMRDVVRVLNKDDKHISWTTPLGFPVKQKYNDTRASRIMTLLGEKVSFVKCHVPLDKIDKTRQANGMVPNYVHSLDASVAQLTTVYAKEAGINSLAMVHDSFATHSTDCGKLNELVRKATSDIFQTDQLNKLREEITKQTKRELPELPKYGSLNPSDVLSSEYFFA